MGGLAIVAVLLVAMVGGVAMMVIKANKGK